MNYKIAFRTFLVLCSIGLVVFIAGNFMETVSADNPELNVRRANGNYALTSPQLGEIRRSTREISDERIINLSDSQTRIVLWNEGTGNSKTPFYAVSNDGNSVSRVTETSYELKLRYGKFDPLVSTPEVSSLLQTENRANGKNVYIVQFVTQPLEQYQTTLNSLGAKSFIYLPNHARIVEMDAGQLAQVSALPFVRWVGKYEAAYKLEEFLIDGLTGDSQLPPMRYNIMTLERGAATQNGLSNRIRSLGGTIDATIPQGYRMEATLTAQQLLSVAQENEVMFIDRWSEPETDMDIVRSTGGADFLQTTLGYTGQGVRAEVMDNGIRKTHVDFQAPTVLEHGPNDVMSHGTSTYGIVFGTGVGNPSGRGMLPSAGAKIFADYDSLTNRYTHTAELKQAPYNAVFQSNSWGAARTFFYTTISAEMDDILFQNDFLLLNSQSNAGNQDSRPQAWAKNVVSIGGVRHYNTATFDDDRWKGSSTTGASIGPAADGRIKPDLAHFYDSVLTSTSSSDTAYTQFSGTSAATPIVAGHFGLFYEMWHNGLFGNPTGATVFDSAPHMTTAKAMVVNTATQWDMTIPGTDVLRRVQGFGRPDLQNMYNLRNKMFIVDETDVLINLQTKSYTVKVPSGSTDPLKVTMAYNDPMGSPSASQARINDLTLKVTAPDNTVYYGNNGLNTGMWSTSGGSPNTVDTVENVFIEIPAAGTWTVEVIASEINQDARVETAGVIDADFGLVISGIERTAGRTPFDYDGDGKSDVSVFRPSNGAWYVQQSTAGFTGVIFGQNGDLITPGDFDGDGKTDVAVFRPANGAWYRINSSDNTFSGVAFGQNGDIPLPGDYDGDSKADINVFRPANGAWYRINSSNGSFFGTLFGQNGDKPLLADYDGDGKSDIAVFRPSAGAFYSLDSSTGAFSGTPFGFGTDIPTPADFDGDGKTDIAVFRPSNGAWYRYNSSTGAFVGTIFGQNGDIPTPADYDGDGKADIAVFRAGIWYLLQSQNGFTGFAFGASTDKPTEAAYIQ